MIRVAAQHAIGLHYLQSSLATVCLGVDHVFNAPETAALPINIAKRIEQCFPVYPRFPSCFRLPPVSPPFMQIDFSMQGNYRTLL